MQISLHRRSRLEGFLGPFFLVQLVFWLQALSAMAAQRFSRPHEASWRRRTSRGLMAAQDITGPHGGTDSGYKGDFGYSFGYNFGYKIFLEQLCFSIDLSVSSLL